MCDFNRSFIRWRIDLETKSPLTVSHKPPIRLNNVRVPLECRAEITDLKSGRVEVIVLGAACKTERVGVSRDIWTVPNADFNPVAGGGQFMAIKMWDKVEKGVMRFPESLGVQSERQMEEVNEAFDRFSIGIKMVPGNLLENIDEVLAVLSGDGRIICRTEYATDTANVVLEFPLKTVNFSERDHFYHVDTGPVLFFDPDRDEGEVIERFSLAYVAYNHPAWAEFLVNVPTALEEGVSVHHYSKSVGLETRNSLIGIDLSNSRKQ